MALLCENLTAGTDGLQFAGQSVAALAREYGTPLYLLDADRVRTNCRRIAAAMREAFGPEARPLYAGKAACFKALYPILAAEGFGADAVSMGEVATALAAGFDAKNLCLHGCAKTDADLAAALAAGVGLIAVDNTEELEALSRIAAAAGKVQDILLRLTPGVDPHTFAAVTTGTIDSKFGLAIPTGAARRAALAALALPGIRLRGWHCHIGSQIFTADPFCSAAQIMLDFTAQFAAETGYLLDLLDLGGGFGVQYTAADPACDPAYIIAQLGEAIREHCAALGIPVPAILLEPGRSIAADAGLSVYTVQAAKHLELAGHMGEAEAGGSSGQKHYLLVDGGMADNPRCALYGARYTAYAVAAPLAAEGAADTAADTALAARGLARWDIAGCCCESGDVLTCGALLPADMARGQLVAIATGGAYQFSMASSYNRLPRPPLVLLEAGNARLAVRRQSHADVMAGDV